MLRFKNHFAILTLLFSSLSFAADTAPMPNPVKMLNDTAQETIQQITAVRAKLKINDDAPVPFAQVYKIIDTLVIPDVDLVAISERTIGSAFKEASAQDQQRFIDAYKTLLINTYGRVLANYKDQKVQFFKVRGGYEGLSQVNVNSQFIFANRDPIKVTYTLIFDKKANEWNVVDVSVEGISLLESFKSQFTAELQKGGLKQLLATLDAHNAAITAQISHSQPVAPSK